MSTPLTAKARRPRPHKCGPTGQKSPHEGGPAAVAEDRFAAIGAYGAELGIPVTDALLRPPSELVDMVLAAFPALEGRLAAAV